MESDSPDMKSMFGGKPSGGFFDLPMVTAGEEINADIALLGVPGATPYSSVGNYCADGPDAIRAAFGWPGVLGHHDFDIDGYLLPEDVVAVDCGNLEFNKTDFAENRARIQQKVEVNPECRRGPDCHGR